MHERVRATYHNGAFIPAVPVSLPEAAEVELIIEPASASPSVEPPSSKLAILGFSSDARILRSITKRLRTAFVSIPRLISLIATFLSKDSSEREAR